MKTKTAIIATLQLLAVLLLCSCSTVYHAPDAKKLNASATRLKKAIVKSHETAKKAQVKHQEVEQAANQTFLDQREIEEKYNEFVKRLPPELQPEGKIIQDKIAEQHKHNDELQVKVQEETEIHQQLAKDNSEVTAAKTDWDMESSNYQKAAAAVAAQATEDNKKLSNQLWKQKLFKWLGFGAIGLVIVLFIAGILAWKSGKLAIWAGKTASKF